MSYSMMGATDLTTVPFFLMRNGVAKARNEPTMIAFQALQMQLSRLGDIRADGEIGPATTKLYNKVMGAALTAEKIAAAVLGLTASVKVVADSAKAPAPKPVPKPTPVPGAGGALDNQTPPPYTGGTLLDDAMGFAMSPMGLMAGAAIVGIFLLTKRKKSSSPAPTTAIAVPKVV